MGSSKNAGANALLVAKTTLRLEAMRYEENLVNDESLVGDPSGWKFILGRDFEGKVSASDIAKFVDDVEAICDGKYGEFDKGHVCASLFTKFRCTIDDSMLGFILKSKTTVEPEMPQVKRGFFLFRWIGSGWNLFKWIYNGMLEGLKIG